MKERILVTRSSMPSLEEYIEEIKGLWDTHWLTNMGVKHKQLENDLAEYMGVPKENLALFVNGHQALECVIEALGLGNELNEKGVRKDEVITTPFTFASTTNAIVRKGLTPVFCDIKRDDYTIDESKIEDLISDRTCAIIPVHVYGNLCAVDKIDSLAQKHNLKVIYDAAHAFAVEKDGVSVARYGDASMFSFHATKVFNTIEGGAICLKDKRFKSKLNDWKNFGITGPETVEYVGGNAKMNEFSAAMGICNLRHLNENILKRKKIVEEYDKKLSGVNGIVVNRGVKEGERGNYAYYPVIFKENVLGFSRDDVFEKLKKNGICARKYFYPLTSTYECYCERFDAKKTPVALEISKQVLTLPLYPELEQGIVDKICDIILGMIE